MLMCQSAPRNNEHLLTLPDFKSLRQTSDKLKVALKPTKSKATVRI